MSAKLLKQNSDKKILQGQNYNNESVYVAPGTTNLKYLQTTIGQGSLDQPLGRNISVRFDYQTQTEVLRLKRCLFKMTISNSGANNVIFKNVWNMFEKIIFTFSDKHKVELSRRQLILAYNEHLNNMQTPEQRANELFNVRNEYGDTYVGEVVPAASTLSVNLDLTPVLPTIAQNHVFGRGTGIFSSFGVEFFFSQNTTNPASMCEYVSSSDSNVSWSNTQISFSNMHIERVCEQTNNSAFLTYNNLFDWTTYYKIYEVPLTNWTVGAKYVFKPSDTQYSEASNLLDYQFLVLDTAALSAHNSANGQRYHSGPSVLGFKVVKNDVVLFDHTGPSKLKDRKCYLIDFYKRRYAVDCPTQLLDNADTGLSKNYMFGSVLDMSNVETERQDDYVITSENSKNTDWNIEVTCETAMSTSNATLLIAFHHFKSLSKFSS